MLETLEKEAGGDSLMTISTVALAGISVSADDPDQRDDCAKQADGARVWPPRAVRADDVAADVTQMIRAMIADTKPRKQKKRGPSRPGSTAGVELYRSACQKQLERTTA